MEWSLSSFLSLSLPLPFCFASLCFAWFRRDAAAVVRGGQLEVVELEKMGGGGSGGSSRRARCARAAGASLCASLCACGGTCLLCCKLQRKLLVVYVVNHRSALKRTGSIDALGRLGREEVHMVANRPEHVGIRFSQGRAPSIQAYLLRTNRTARLRSD